MKILNAETAVEEIVSEKTLDDLYTLVMDLSSDVSGLKRQVLVLQEDVVNLQEIISQKLDVINETLQNMPEYGQLEIIIAFLLMLVCFELMRLIRGWTNSFKLKGGN